MKKTVCEINPGIGEFRVGLDSLHKGWETVWFSGSSSNETIVYKNHFKDHLTRVSDYFSVPNHTLLMARVLPDSIENKYSSSACGNE